MAEFIMPSTIDDFATLDMDEFAAGCLSVMAGEPEPINATRSFWCGDHAMRIELGMIDLDAETAALTAEVTRLTASQGAFEGVTFG